MTIEPCNPNILIIAVSVWIVACAFAFAPAKAQAAIKLARDGKSDYSIVLPEKSDSVERTAAKELQSFLKDVTGAELPIESHSGAGPSIFVANETSADLGPDGIRIKTEGKNLHLSGTAPRGALYAVYTLLEDQVGCRWWTNIESTIPHKPTLVIPDLDIKYTPKLRYRETFHDQVLGDNYQAAARMKLNGHFSRIPENWGGHYDILGWCHTSYQLLPPGQYFKDHPEWYSLRGGKRNPDGGQMCWSNPDMQKAMAEQALKRIRKNPSAGIISISQNDQLGPCECDVCRAIDKANGGAHSASLITGVNAIAAIVAKEYPDFLVETLAYQYTRKPPTQVKPAKNVLVRLCSIECDFSHPLSGPSNKGFGDDLRTWSTLADNLFVWNYVTDFSSYLIPHPNMTPMADDLRFFVDHNVVGVFEQADSANHLAGDMLPLRCWLQAHLLWDPSRDQDALTKEFLNGYYGAAGPDLYAYLQIVNAPAKDPKFRCGCYHTDADYLTSDAVAKCAAHFDAAEKAVAADATLLARVKRERLALEHVQLLKWDFPRRIADEAKQKKISEDQAAIAVGADYEAKAKDFCTRAVAAGVKSNSEGGSFEAAETSLVMRYGRFIPPKLPKPGDALPKGAVDIQEGQFQLAGEGNWVSIVPDADASDGKAARMPGEHTNWAVQYHIPDNASQFGKGPWTCYFVVRAKVKDKNGAAFKYGLFDQKSNQHRAMEGVSAEQAGDEKYHAYGIKMPDLKPGMYFWVSPAGNASVDGVYVDRIYCVKDGTK